jgi:hypothetical protein
MLPKPRPENHQTSGSERTYIWIRKNCQPVSIYRKYYKNYIHGDGGKQPREMIEHLLGTEDKVTGGCTTKE